LRDEFGAEKISKAKHPAARCALMSFASTALLPCPSVCGDGRSMQLAASQGEFARRRHTFSKYFLQKEEN
jgi:hypothetical protein